MCAMCRGKKRVNSSMVEIALQEHLKCREKSYKSQITKHKLQINLNSQVSNDHKLVICILDVVILIFRFCDLGFPIAHISIYAVIRKKQAVVTASSRDHFISRLEAAPTGSYWSKLDYPAKRHYLDIVG